MIGQHAIEKVKGAAYGVTLLGSAGLDWLLGSSCSLCGERVRDRHVVRHHETEHAGDSR